MGWRSPEGARRCFSGAALLTPPSAVSAPIWDSSVATYRTGIAAEIADAALYDELLKVTDNLDVVQVYKNLQAASLNSHLPAFEACN